MADQINMGGLNLNDQHSGIGGRSYIPPHMRGKMGGPAPGGPAPGGPGPAPGGPPMNGINNSAWAG